jgi:hypothetical protein
MKNLHELESELKAIELQLQQAKSDRDLENSLKKRKEEIENEIRKLKMFVMTKGFSATVKKTI